MGVAVLVTVAGRHSFSSALTAAAVLLALGAALLGVLLGRRQTVLR